MCASVCTLPETDDFTLTEIDAVTVTEIEWHLPKASRLVFMGKKCFQKMMRDGDAGYGASPGEMEHLLKEMHLSKASRLEFMEKNVFRKMMRDGDAGYGASPLERCGEMWHLLERWSIS